MALRGRFQGESLAEFLRHASQDRRHAGLEGVAIPIPFGIQFAQRERQADRCGDLEHSIGRIGRVGNVVNPFGQMRIVVQQPKKGLYVLL